MNNRYFQWLAGDKKGQILVFDKIESEDENVFITFKDRSRINENFVAQLNTKDLTGKLMAEIDHPQNCWSFKEEWVGREEEVWETNADGERVCVQPFVPGKKIVKLISPRPTPKTHSSFGAVSNVQVSPPPQETDYFEKTSEPIKQINISDPVYILMSKAKKLDSEITMGMIVSLPPKSLYELAKESFDDGDEKFIQYIVDEITVNEIKDALKVAIKQMYEETLSL
jgi:hypothetical protein